MQIDRIGGIVLLVAGVILFTIGLSASDSFADRWSNFFTGRFTDSTIWYMVGGGAAAAFGAILLLIGGRRRSMA